MRLMTYSTWFAITAQILIEIDVIKESSHAEKTVFLRSFFIDFFYLKL